MCSSVAVEPALPPRKGIILAGGLGTRLYPATRRLNKHLLPIYDKPMIYYPLSTLMLAGIRDIMIVTTGQAVESFRQLLNDGSDWGIQISYGIQQEPRGLVDAVIVAEPFASGEPVTVVLGDNLFYGRGFAEILKHAASHTSKATLFAYPVGDPSRFGVIELDDSHHPISLVEKPLRPASSLAVTGLYFYDQNLFEYARQVSRSPRGETEITDLNKIYLREKRLHVEILGRGFTWMDAGTHESLLDASNYVSSVEKRQGLKIACLEEIAWRRGYIDNQQLCKLCRDLPGDYRSYLDSLAANLPQ